MAEEVASCVCLFKEANDTAMLFSAAAHMGIIVMQCLFSRIISDKKK
jgi:hypothetical protein